MCGRRSKSENYLASKEREVSTAVMITLDARGGFARCLFLLGLTKAPFFIASQLKSTGMAPMGTDLLRAKCRLRQGRHQEAHEMVKEELRLHPGNAQAKRLLDRLAKQSRTAKVAAPADEFGRILTSVRPFTMMSEARLRTMYTNARRICEEDREGNFVECGVAAGGCSALLAYVIKNYSKRPRLLFCFDTFEGMPKPTSVDTHAGLAADESGWGTGTCAAPIDALMQAAKSVGAADVIRPIKGLFGATLPASRESIGSIALLHLDGDWYESTRDILINLYNLVLPGGYLQVDDYGHWEGCRKALDEFEKERNVVFGKTVIDETGISFRKP
jgi:hypothetical protein